MTVDYDKKYPHFVWPKGKDLFHGTLENFKPGDVILPGEHHAVAFASPSRVYAIGLAAQDSAKTILSGTSRSPRIYKVEPIGKVQSFKHASDHLPEYPGDDRLPPPHVTSKGGFKVLEDITDSISNELRDKYAKSQGMHSVNDLAKGYADYAINSGKVFDADPKRAWARGGYRQVLAEPDEAISVKHETREVNGRTFHNFTAHHPNLGIVGSMTVTPDKITDAGYHWTNTGNRYMGGTEEIRNNINFIAKHAMVDEARGIGLHPDMDFISSITPRPK